MGRTSAAADVITWHDVDVDGVTTRYAAGGDGPPVLFLHGWALSSRAYRRPLTRLLARGCRVLAPSPPGLGGSGDLGGDVSMAALSRWAASFLDAVGVSEPVLAIGHAFGGGIVTALAHLQPERVRYLVLLDAADERPLWAWAGRLAREVWQPADTASLLLSALPDLTTNLARNPAGMWRAAKIARESDVSAELADLRRRGLPVLALRSTEDGVIPHGAFDSLCAAIGRDRHVVEGRHSWLLSDQESIAEVLAEVVDPSLAEQRDGGDHSTLAALDTLLAAGGMDAERRTALTRFASPLWLMSDEIRTLAGDLILCDPPLAAGEVRAVVHPIADSALRRLTVVAEDRPGLLADTAAVLAGEGLSVTSATAVTWPSLGLAMHSMTVQPDELFSSARWEVVGERLQSLDGAGVIGPLLRPGAGVHITVHGVCTSADDDESDGARTLLIVEADDQLGLLAALCRHLALEGVTIESLRARTTAGRVYDAFVVRGHVEADAVRRLLRRPAPHRRARESAAAG